MNLRLVLYFFQVIFISSSIASNGYLLFYSDYSGRLVLNNKKEYLIKDHVSKEIKLLPGKHNLKFFSSVYQLDTIIEIQPNAQTLLMLKMKTANVQTRQEIEISPNFSNSVARNLISQFNVEFNTEDYETSNGFVKTVKLKSDKPMKLILEYKINRTLKSYVNSALDLDNKVRFEINDENNAYSRQTNFLLGSRKTEILVVNLKDELVIKFYSSLQDIELEFKVFSENDGELKIIKPKIESKISLITTETVNFGRKYYKATNFVGLSPKASIFKVLVSDKKMDEDEVIKMAEKNNFLPDGKVSVRFVKPNHKEKFERNTDYSQVFMPTIRHNVLGEMRLNQGEEFLVGLKRYNLKEQQEVYIYVLAIFTAKEF
ncbi:MAG: hypothetical protein SNJ77_01525 [Cytophagales bacterium]